VTKYIDIAGKNAAW